MKQLSVAQEAKIITKYQKIVEEAMVDLCLDFEIIGYMALNIGGVKVVGNEHPAVGWTDYKAIYVNAPYADSYNLTKEHIKFLIAHEVFHILILTRSRRDGRDPELWNQASDFAINQLLIEDEEVVSGNKIVGQFIEFGCYDKQYRNMSAEEIYKILEKEQQEMKNLMDQLQGEGNSDSDQDQQNNGDGQGQPQEDDQDQSNGGDEESQDGGQGQGGKFKLDEHLDLDDPKIQEDLREATLRVQQILDQAAAQGKLSSGMKRLINSLPKVKENWRHNLEKYIKSFKKAESTWKRPNRRYLDNKFYFPTRYDTPELNVVVGIDTSGSINEDMLEKFYGHLIKIMKSFKTFEVQVFCWSTVAHQDTYRKLNEKNYQNFNPLEDGYIQSYGGTIAQSAFDYVKTLKDKPDVFIMFTDGYFESEITGFDKTNINTVFAIRKEDNDDFKIPTGIKRGIRIKIED
jgi:predicted metal-dependent peptidase